MKLVYIDPPFNTSQTFESYEDNLEHSIWLTMMRDRLLHLKKMLKNEGAIVVHLDDVEVHRMRLLLDEVFGPGSFISEIAWEKTFKPRNDAKMVSGRHDVLLFYRKTEQLTLNKLPRTDAMNKAYTNPDNDPCGAWTSAPATATGSSDHQGMVFGIQHPITGKIVYPPIGQHWRIGQEKLLEIMSGWNSNYILQEIDDAKERADICNIPITEVRTGVKALIIPDFSPIEAKRVYEKGQWPIVYITSGGSGGFRRKTYLQNLEDRAVEDMWFQTEVGSNDEAKNEIKALFPGDTPFSTPKPERLLERIIHITTNPGDIVLDCFAGSGTTAAVAQKMGRRWITCELLNTTFKNFTLPRLIKVVNDEDAGGITRTKGERIAAENVELPDGVSPDDAANFTSILNKLIADDEELKKDKAIKKIKALSKTKKAKEIINWRGGGGFQVAHLSPQCFDYDAKWDRVMLTENAKGDILIRSIAANLGFSLFNQEETTVFDGRKGKSLLKIVEGVVTVEIVDWLVSQIKGGETIVIAAMSVMDGVRQHLRQVCKGSKIIVIPDDIFKYSKGGNE